MAHETTDFPILPELAKSHQFSVGKVQIGGTAPLCVIAGPCVIESEEHVLFMAGELKKICDDLGLSFIFKASFDKANRTSGKSYRGPGLTRGLTMLSRVRSEIGVPVLTDVHTEEQAGPAAEVCDILQIPAFLCRQTDFILAVGRAGKPVNVKKGQFLAPWDVKNIVDKLRETGCHDVLLTDRGTSFGYGTLVSDFRGLSMMQKFTGMPVCFDATHSVQEPGGLGHASGGKREYVPVLARAACAAGVHALFLETHDRPEEAKSDGPNMIPLEAVEPMLRVCRDLDAVLRKAHG